jgi:hypothetical protein
VNHCSFEDWVLSLIFFVVGLALPPLVNVPRPSAKPAGFPARRPRSIAAPAD